MTASRPSTSGEPDFTTSSYGTTQNQFGNGGLRSGIAFDPGSKCLFVVDGGNGKNGTNDRVMIFNVANDSVPNALNGENAINVSRPTRLHFPYRRHHAKRIGQPFEFELRLDQ